MHLSDKSARVAREDQVEEGVGVIDDRGWNNGNGPIAVAKGRRGEREDGGLFGEECYNTSFDLFSDSSNAGHVAPDAGETSFQYIASDRECYRCVEVGVVFSSNKLIRVLLPSGRKVESVEF